MAQLTSDNIVTIADETIPLSEINDSDLFLFADSEGNFKKTTIEEIVSKCYNDNILGKGKANVPLNTPYVQLPFMPTPDTLYLGTWKDVSADYNGAYLRVLGTNSGTFGTLQKEGLPNIVGEAWIRVREGSSTGDSIENVSGAFTRGAERTFHRATSTSNNDQATKSLKINASLSSSIYGASSHVTPTAHAIKIWKRTA